MTGRHKVAEAFLATLFGVCLGEDKWNEAEGARSYGIKVEGNLGNVVKALDPS